MNGMIMPMNNHKRLWTAATIIAVVIIGGFLVSVPRASEVPEAAAPAIEPAVPEVTLRDSYKKGVHTISGSIMAPTPCTLLTANARYAGSASTTDEHIVVSLAMPSDTGVCLQVLTKVNFSTTIDAPADLPITVFVNGVEATTTPA